MLIKTNVSVQRYINECVFMGSTVLVSLRARVCVYLTAAAVSASVFSIAEKLKNASHIHCSDYDCLSEFYIPATYENM